MIGKRLVPGLLCGLLVLGCASANAQEKTDTPPDTAGERPDGDRERGTERADAARALDRRRAKLERGVIPDLRARLSQAQRELSDLGDVRKQLLIDVNRQRLMIAEEQARLAAQIETLVRQGLSKKDPRVVEAIAALEATKGRQKRLEAVLNEQQARATIGMYDASSSIANTETTLTSALRELDAVRDRLARINPVRGAERRRSANGEVRGEGPRSAHRREDSRASGRTVRSPDGRPDGSPDVNRRLASLEQAIRELHGLFERHGVSPEARERGERRVDRRRDPDWRGRRAPEPRAPLRSGERAPDDRNRPSPPPPRAGETGPRLRDVRVVRSWLATWVREPKTPPPGGRSGLSEAETAEMRKLSARLIELLDKSAQKRAVDPRRPVPEPGHEK